MTNYRFTLGMLVLAAVVILAGCTNPILDDATPEGAALPAFNPGGGVFSHDIDVTVTSETVGAAIHYTIDGSEPTVGSPEYSAPITIAGDGTTVTIRALAVAPGFEPSAIAEASYTIDYGHVSTPQFDPPPGAHESDIAVSITTMTSGATIHFTTDGSDPTTASPVFDPASPIDVSGNTTVVTVKALAVAPGYDDSEVAEGTFTIAYAPAATPAVSLPPEPWVSGRRWWLESSPGATIYYTIDGSPPLDAGGSPTGSAQTYAPHLGVQLTTPDTGATTYTIRAAATGGGFLPSGEFNASYQVIPGRVLGNTLSGDDLAILVNGLPAGLTVTWWQDSTVQFAPGQTLIRVREDLTFDAGGFDVVFDYGFTSSSGGIHIVVGSFSALNVPDPTVQATLVMRGITLRGFATQYRGGAVRVNPGNTLIAQNVRFDRNRAGASPAARDSAGGAIANDGTLVVEDSVFVGNVASGGGAIANFSGTATIRRSRFLGNFLSSLIPDPMYISGGAILAIGGTVNVVDSFFAGNDNNLGTGFGVLQYGGALSAFDGTINVHGSQFAGNRADVGAAAYVSEEGAHNGEIRISSSAFYENSSRRFNPTVSDSIIAAGVSGTEAARLDLRSSTFVDNTILSVGGFGAFGGIAHNPLLINQPVGLGTFQNNFTQTGVDAADVFVALPDKGPDDAWGTDDDVAGDFRLRASADTAIRSGVIDSGDTGERASDFADVDEDGISAENEPFDLAGNSRVQGGAIDIGALEH